MKKVFTTIVIVFISASLFSQSFYRYQGKKIDLRVDNTMFVIQLDKQLAEKQNSALEKQLQKREIEFFQKMSNNRFLVVGAKPQPENYEYFSNVYRNVENGMVIILPRIVVKFKNDGILQTVLNKYKGKLVEESGGNQKYILKCNVVQSEAVLQLVNELDSTDDVVWCEPEFLSDYKVNNTLYPQQYYLKNTGQNGGTVGIDINVEPAWNITNGNSCITVAVIDAGVDRNHEDMGTRVLEGFTIRNATGEGEPQNTNSLNNKSHGMACAGIVAASNNTIGIRGVASNVNILPVNIVPDQAYELFGNIIEGFGTNIEIAEAIDWAWHRADVLSCSWGGGNPSNDITAAIDNARTFGRNGNGSVVVFASGNGYPNATDVSYPGRVDGVITVGAINNQGTIWNYSQRGISMDLVAPSGNIGSGDVRTTDRMGDLGYNSGNYMNNFGGTSAACPQVSGVAALMLSIRPDLTEAQVRTTLQQTAIDMGTSGFDNTYGYGRVNAFAALRAIYPTLSGPSTICSSSSTFTVNNVPTGSTISWDKSYNLAEVSGQGTTAYTVKASGDLAEVAAAGSSAVLPPQQPGSSGWIKATISSPCGSISLPQKTVWAGLPGFKPVVTGPTNINCGVPYMYFEQNSQAIYWSVPYSMEIIGPAGPGYKCTVRGREFAAAGVIGTASNQCGSFTDILEVDISCSSLAISPNPSTGETTLTIIGSNTDKKSDIATKWDLEIYDSMQHLKTKTQKITGNERIINTSGWKDGVYIVRIKIDNEILSGKLVVNNN